MKRRPIPIIVMLFLYPVIASGESSLSKHDAKYVLPEVRL